MGRIETPVDPLAGPVAELAHELRKLRQEAGNPTYRDMARAVGLSAPTLSRAAAGRQLPSLAVVEAYAQACGQDPEPWKDRWRRAWEEVVEQAPDRRAPYLGLAPFDAGDTDLFFGRDELLARLRAMLDQHRMVAVAGPSGSGKSSLVRAGLVPGTEAVVFTPGEHPVARLAEQAIRGQLVVVDQFEEAYTLCADRRETHAFVDALLDLAERCRVVLTVRADRFGDCAAHPGLARVLSAATLLVGPMTAPELRDSVIKPAAAVGLLVERELTARIVAEVEGRPGALPMLSHTLLEVWRRRQGRTLTLDAYEELGGVQGALSGTAEELYASLPAGQAAAARRVLLRLVHPAEDGPDTRRPATPEELDADADTEVTEVLARLAAARMITIAAGQVELSHEALIDGWPRLRGWLDTDREALRQHRALSQAAHAWAGLGHDPGALYRGSRLTLAEQVFASAERRAGLSTREREFLTASRTARDREHHAATRTRRRLRVLWATLTVLFVVAGVAIYAGNRTQQARQREQAVADARRVAGLADATHSADPVLATLLSVAAYRLADVPETRSALVTSYVQPELPPIALPEHFSAYGTLISSDGRAAVSLDRGTANVLRLADGHVSSYPVPPGDKMLSAVGPDGHTVAAGFGDTTTVQTSTGRTVATVRGEAFTFGSSGRTFARYDETAGAVLVTELSTGRTLARVPVRDAPVVAISPDDKLVATCGEEGPAQLWAITPPRRTRLADPPICTSTTTASFSGDARKLSLADEGGAGVWDVRTGDPLLDLSEGVQQAVLSPDGAYLATRATQLVSLWRVDSQDKVLAYPTAGQSPDELAWADRHTIRYLDGRLVHTLDVSPVAGPADATGPVTLALDHDGTVTAAATDDDQGFVVRFGPPGATAPISEARLPLPPATSPGDDYAPEPMAALSRDGDLAVLAVGRAPGTPWQHQLVIWDVRAGRARTTLELGPGDPVAALAITPDGARIAVTRQLRAFDDRQTPTGLEIWDVARTTRLARLPVAPLALAFAPDGRTIASDVGLIDVASGTVNSATGAAPAVRRNGAPVLPEDFSLTAAAYSADGRHLAIDDMGGHLELWDTRAWRLRAAPSRTMTGGPWPLAAAGPSYELAFSHDGTLLAAAGDTGVSLWDLGGGRQLGSAIALPETSIRAIAFSADDRQLIVGGTSAVRTVPVDPPDVAGLLCRRAGRELTREEWSFYLPGHPRRALC